jgi:hypothetical protein
MPGTWASTRRQTSRSLSVVATSAARLAVQMAAFSSGWCSGASTASSWPRAKLSVITRSKAVCALYLS